jgi:hypothetical protein
VTIAPLIGFWLFAAVALFGPEAFALYFFLCTGPFGALNTLPEAIASTANVVPQSVAALIFSFRVYRRFLDDAKPLGVALDWRAYGLYLGYTVLAIGSALMLPSIFAGRVQVVPLDGGPISLLGPSSANLNQSIYLGISLLSTIALFVYLRTGDIGRRREQTLKALWVAGLLFVITGLIDYSGQFDALVATFRTAKYTIFAATEVASFRRVTGFLPEASAYGPPCLVLGATLFFSRSAVRSRFLRAYGFPGLGLILVGMAALSTSSTAYLGIFAFLGAVGARVAIHLVKRKPVRGVAIEMATLAGLVFLLMIVGYADPDLLSGPIKLLDTMVFRKTMSDSFTERESWNNAGKHALRETWGLGVGAGSTRTSNWSLAVLSNTGVVGFLLIAAFLVVNFSRAGSKASRRSAALSEGAKLGLMIFIVGALASGTTVEPGPMLAILTAVVLASSHWADRVMFAERSRRGARADSKRPRPAQTPSGAKPSRQTPGGRVRARL